MKSECEDERSTRNKGGALTPTASGVVAAIDAASHLVNAESSDRWA